MVKAVISYLTEVGQELSKVTWPKKEEVIKLTLIVFIISATLGLYVGVLDFAFTKLLGFWISG
ncbi:preprotein translocase subunit SecE [Patescibacteria group bacterium]|nr:preprotein translocase subunit SecE [Patescibacteria group bacterium]